ncbi:hypothetical protein [Brevundimonas sp.]|uniref:hypothetical protein n=1 Tax=Brevundimonas sp. TaxID=1871086 RepID=UPI002FCB4415
MADGSVPLVLSPEPFSREVAYLEQPAGRTLRGALLDAVKSGAISADDLSRTVVYIDGQRLERDQTLDHVLAEGEVVNIVVEPLGGGGRKDIGQILMTIAVIAVSMWVGGGGTALGTTLLARVAAAAILTLGQAAVAAMFAPETDNKAKVNERYALQTASNQYRPWAPQPIALGEVVVAPDFAAKTYTQSVGDEVWLHGILGLHRGACTVADLKIGDTLASSMGPGDFRMVEHLTPGPRTFTIYPNDADQLDLQEELEATTSSATTVVRAGSAEGEQFDFDFFLPGGLHFQKDDGRVLTASVTVYTRYRPVDEDGSPTGGGTWSTGPTVALISTTKEPMRVTRSVSLPIGRYEFEFKRSLKPDNNEKRRDRIALTAIRSIAFRKPVADETLSLIEFAVRATALNQGTLAPITCRIIPICETWNGSAWGAPAPTSNPAALTRWLLTGPAPARPLLSAQADMRLRAWSALCETYNWRAGVYLQDERRQDQVLGLLEQAGRASLFWDGTQIVASPWVEKPAPRQLFTGSNLRDHKWTLVYPEPVHALRVEFQNIEEGGDPDEIYVYADGYAETAAPGVQAATLVEALRLEGQKTPERAYRDGRWELGARLHRRRIDTWTADVEHLVSSYGDRVRLAWQRVEGGTSTRIRCRRWSGGLVSGLRLAQPVEMKPGESYAADIRLASGVALAVPLINEADGAPVITREVQFAVPRAPEFAPRRDDLIAFGVPSRISEDTEIIGVEPGEGLTAVLTGVRYVAPLLMAGETGPIPGLTTRLSRQRQANPPSPRLLGVQPDPSGVRVSFDVPPWAGSPIVAYSARWRPTPTGGQESGWLALPPLDANARTLITPPPRALPVPVDQDDETLIDIEVRAVTAAGQTSPVPLLIEGLAVRDTPFMPTNVSVTPATRTAPDGSSHGVLVFAADALDAAVSTDMIVEVRRYPPGGGSPDAWEASGLILPANNPTGDILGLRAGTAYGTRAAFRTSDGWYSDWTTEIVRTVPAGSNVAGDVTPITPANVAGTPALMIPTLISPDGTQISRLTGTWAAAADALSYIVELDNGTVVTQIPTSANAISQIVPTGPTYRYRAKALSRTGTPSGAWSSWSASVAASGDTVAPGVISYPTVEAYLRGIQLGWVNPTDADYNVNRIYRNTVATIAGATVLGEGRSTSYGDTDIVPGTTYHYFNATVDRSGNTGTPTYMGSATARYINRVDGDIQYNDPDLVTQFGNALTYTGQTPWGTYSGRATTALDAAIDSSGYVTSGFGPAFEVPEIIAAFNGTQLSRNPEYVGADTTGYGLYAASPKTYLTMEYSADTPNGSKHRWKITYDPAIAGVAQNPGWGGIVQTLNDGGASASGPGYYRRGSVILMRITAYIPVGRLLTYTTNSIGTGGAVEYLTTRDGQSAWFTYVVKVTIGPSGAFGDTGYLYMQGGPDVAFSWYLCRYDQLDITSAQSTYLEGTRSNTGAVQNTNTLVTSLGNALTYTGQTAWGTFTAPTTKLDYLNNSGELLDLAHVVTKPFSALTGRTANLMNYSGGATVDSLKPGEVGANVTETRNALTFTGQTAWATSTVPVSHLTQPGANILYNGSFKLGTQGWTNLGIGEDTYSGRYAAVSGTTTAVSQPHGCDAGTTLTFSGEFFTYLATTTWYIVFTDAVGAYKGEGAYIGGTGWARTPGNSVLVPTGATLFQIYAYTSANAGYSLARKLKVEVGTTATPWNDDRTNGALYQGGATIDSLKPQEIGSNVTETRNALTFTGQTLWATLTRSVVSISKIDDTGRIIDGQALPLNGMSKSSTLNPAYPLAPGATPSTQITVAASTVTFAGGTTLSLPSGTLSGLTASTYYSVFRDLVASSYVAVSGSTTTYFTSAQRYLYIGTQATEEVGGGYEPPPPPPPGYGGGFGDRPLYVEP